MTHNELEESCIGMLQFYSWELGEEFEMSINAIVRSVYINEDGTGQLNLEGEERGQPVLRFDTAPEDVTALNGRQIWGSSDSIMANQTQIAYRIGYTEIKFCVDSFKGVFSNAS